MTVMDELPVINLSWGEAQRVAKDGKKWREVIAASCPIEDEEDSLCRLTLFQEVQSLGRGPVLNFWSRLLPYRNL